MGYRSDVRIIVTKKGFERLNKLVEEKMTNESENLMKSLDIKKDHEKYVYFGWDYVKWYEGDYEDVNAIMDSLNDLEEEGYSFRYARIGENYEDIEERYYDSEKEDWLDFPYIERKFEDNQF